MGQLTTDWKGSRTQTDHHRNTVIPGCLHTSRTEFVYFGELRRKIGLAITTRYITDSLYFLFEIPSNHCSLKLNQCHFAAAELKLNS